MTKNDKVPLLKKDFNEEIISWYAVGSLIIL